MKRIYRPGDRIFVGKGQACGMNFTDGVWALEYARGSIWRLMSGVGQRVTARLVPPPPKELSRSGSPRAVARRGAGSKNRRLKLTGT